MKSIDIKLSPCAILFVVFIITISSCRAPQELVYKDFKSLTIEKLGFSTSAVKMDLLYYNPNNFGLQLKRFELDIFVDNSYLGHSTQEYQVNIPKRQDFLLPVRIEVDMKNVLKNALGSLFGQEVIVKITGTVTIGKANVYKSFPVLYEGLQKFSVF